MSGATDLIDDGDSPAPILTELIVGPPGAPGAGSGVLVEDPDGTANGGTLSVRPTAVWWRLKGGGTFALPTVGSDLTRGGNPVFFVLSMVGPGTYAVDPGDTHGVVDPESGLVSEGAPVEFTITAPQTHTSIIYAWDGDEGWWIPIAGG